MDLSDSWVGKTAGPRIRIIVSDIHSLPSTVLIPGRVPGSTVEHKMTYSGLPNRCVRCKNFGHNVKQCTLPLIKKGSEQDNEAREGVLHTNGHGETNRHRS